MDGISDCRAYHLDRTGTRTGREGGNAATGVHGFKLEGMGCVSGRKHVANHVVQYSLRGGGPVWLTSLSARTRCGLQYVSAARTDIMAFKSLSACPASYSRQLC